MKPILLVCVPFNTGLTVPTFLPRQKPYNVLTSSESSTDHLTRLTFVTNRTTDRKKVWRSVIPSRPFLSKVLYSYLNDLFTRNYSLKCNSVWHDITLIPNQTERSFHVLANMGDLVSCYWLNASVAEAHIGWKCRWTFQMSGVIEWQ